MIYRTTKFNPKKRNKQGYFLDNSEWTAISDVGKLLIIILLMRNMKK